MKIPAENALIRGNKRISQNKYAIALFLLLILITVGMSMVRPRFLSGANYLSIVNQFPEFGLMALGVMLAMITGGIDLSVVGIANLTSICCALALKSLMPAEGGGSILFSFATVLLIAFSIGTVCGVFNGILVSKIKIPPILATLGSYELFIGICVIITQGKPVSGLPMEYSNIMAHRFFGMLPVSLIVFIAAVILISLLISKTSYGSKLYMIGTNPKAAVFSGLNTTKIYLKTYFYSGLLAAVAGLVMLANYNSAKADYGSSYMLQSILICVLGGVNPNGGFGKVSGVVLAVLILQFLSSGLNMFTMISNFYKPFIWGSVLLIVMVVNYYMGKSKTKASDKKDNCIGK